MIKEGYKYSVKYVKHLMTKKDNPFTVFSIGGKIKGSSDNRYHYYDCIVWNRHVDIVDGDKLTIVKIESIEPSEYNGKIKYTLVLDVETQEAYVDVVPSSKSDAVVIVDDNASLPFDL